MGETDWRLGQGLQSGIEIDRQKKVKDVDISDLDDVEEKWQKERHQSNNKKQESKAKMDFDSNWNNWKESFFMK